MSTARPSVLRIVDAALFALIATGLPSAAVAQTSGTWTSASGGTWNNTANWSGGAVASGTGASADFSTLNISGTQTVVLNAAYTLGSLSFADTTTSSTGSWVISNGGTAANTLTLAASAGTPSITVANMGSGSVTISANVAGSQGFVLNSSTTSNPGTLVLSGSSTVSGNIDVNAGGLVLANTSPTAYTSGTFRLANGTSLRIGANSQTFGQPIVLSGGTATVGSTNLSSSGLRVDFSNVISGSGGLTIDSLIGFTTGANHTYSGNTTLTSTGFVLLRALGSGSAGAPTAGPFGTGTVTLAGGGMRQFNSSNATIYNTVNVTADTTIGTGGAATDTTIFAGPMTLVGGTRTFTVAGSSMQYSGPGIGDGGNNLGLTKAGSGLLMLGGSNTYSGATTLTSGTLRIHDQNAVQNSTFIHSGTGTLVFNSSVSGNAFTFGGLAASSTAATVALQNNAGTPAAITLTVGGNNATTSYAGTLTGSGSLVKVGTGVLSLSGSNSYAGTMTVNAGVLAVSSSNALPGWGTAGRVAVAAAGSLAVGNDMTLQQAIDAGYLNAASGLGFDTTAGDRSTSDVIAGSRSFVKAGGNTLTMTGASTYTGTSTLYGGTVNLGVAQNGTTSGPLGASGAITFAGGALQYSASNTTEYTARIVNSGSAVAIDTNGQSVTFTGGIDSTNTGGFRKLGSGTLTLSGSSGYTGATTLAGGVLALGNANAIAATGNVTFTGGTLQYSASNTADLASRIVSSTAAISIDTNNQSVTWAGNLANTNTGGLTKTGAGLLTLSGSNAFTGVIGVTGGTLAVSGTTAFPTGVTGVSLNGGVLQASGNATLNIPGGIPTTAPISLGASGGTLSAALAGGNRWFIYAGISGGAGTGSLTFAGVGEIVLGGSSSYAGGTVLSPVQVAIGSDAAFGTGTITFAGGSLRPTSAGSRTLSNAVAILGGATFYTAGGGNDPDVILSGPITLSGSSQTVTTTMVSGSTNTGLTQFNGAIADGGAGLGLTKAGSGVLVLGGANTYSGTTTLSAGTLRVNNSNALAGGGNVLFSGGTLQYTGSNQADYSSRIVGSGSAIAIDTNGQNVSFTSALAASNSGGLTKSGSGTLTLAANNAYTGLTTVSGGTLQIGNGGATGSIPGSLTLSNTAAVIFNRSDDVVFGNVISGTGRLQKSGAGTLTLSGSANALAGSITILGGAVVTTNAASLTTVPFTTYAYTIDSGTLMSAPNAAANGFSSTFASLAIGSGGATIRSDQRMDIQGVISGTSPTASLTYGTTTGTVSGVIMVVSSNGTYAGGTKLESGVAMVVDNNSAFGTGSLELAGAALRSRGSQPPRTLANAVTISANTQFFGAVSDPNLTFTGATLLSGGTRTLQVDNVITSGTSAGQPGAVFTNVIGDGGNGFGITKTGAGVLALGGANTYSGATTISNGTVQLQNQAALQYSTLSLSGVGGVVFDSVVSGNAFTLGGLASSSGVATLSLQNSAATAIALTVGGNNASTTYAGTLTGAGSLEKFGSGSLILSGSNTFAGATTVTTGTLQIGGGGTTGSLAGNVVNNAALVFNRSDASSYAGGISGSGSVTKSGAGTLTLSGSNSYAGTTTLAGGMIAVTGTNALPSSGTVTFTGGTLQYSTAYTADLSTRIANSTAAISVDTNWQTVTWAGGLAATNTGGLTKSGNGWLVLSGSNAFTGTLTLAGGALSVDNANALPSTGAISFTGGMLRYTTSYKTDLSTRIVGSTGTVSIDTYNQNITWAGSLANTNVGGLAKSGGGTLTLTASNAFSGDTTVNAGVLLVNHAAALGSGTSITVNAGFPGGSVTIGNGITTGAGKTITVSSGGANSDGGLNVISGTGTWAGNVVLNGRLGYTNGNLVITGSVGGSSFTVSGYGGDTNTNVAGYAVTLAGPTGYSGATGILRGWLKIGADNTLPVGTTLDVFNNSTSAAAQAATFDLNGFNQTVAGLTSSGNNGRTGYANGYVTNTGATVKTLTVNQATSGTYGGLVTGNLAFTKSGAGNLTLMPIFVTTAFSNAFVNGTNTFTGDTRVDGGTLTLSAATGSNSLALAGSTFDSSGAGTLSFGSMTAATFGGLKGSGNLALQNGSTQAVALTVGANGGSTTYSGGLSGAGSIVKTGAGKLTLAGNNSYAGTTTVSGGILAVNGDQSAATGAVSVASVAALMGSGTIGGDTTVAGLHSPGNSPGIQTFAGDLTYSGGSSTVLWELAANTESNSPLAFDQIVVGGDLNFAGLTTLSLSFNGTGSTVNWSDAFWDSNRTWTLYAVSGATTNFGNLILAGSPSSWFDMQSTPQSLASARPDASFSITQDGSNVTVVYAIVPEPDTLIFAGIGMAMAGWSLRKRRRTRYAP